MEGMHEEADSQMSPPTLSTLDHAALTEICSKLDAKSLIALQMVSVDTRKAAIEDRPWREAFGRDFPFQFSSLELRQGPIAWRSEYAARAGREKRWASGGLKHPAAVLRSHVGSAFGAIFLQDPFPRRLALTGAITQANQRGELTLWELDTPAAGVGRLGWQLQQAANAGDAPASDALSSGIFNICQRPGTEEVVYTTFGPGVHVVRLQRGPLSDDSAQDMSQDGSLDGSGHGSTLPAWVGHTNLTSQFAALKSDSVHLNPASYYDFAHVCQLIGHSNGCSAVRAAKCSAMTASFDGSLKLFHLPPPSVNDGGAPDPPVEINAAASYEDHASHMGGPPNSDQVEPVCSLDLSRDWTRMASGGNDMQVKVWDVATQRIVLRLQGHQGWIWHMEAEDHGLNRCVTSSTDGTVRTWDFRAGVQTGCLNLSQHYNDKVSPVSGVVPRADGRYLIAGSFDSFVYVIDRRMMQVLHSLAGHEERVSRVVLHEDTVLAPSFDGNVVKWEFE